MFFSFLSLLSPMYLSYLRSMYKFDTMSSSFFLSLSLSFFWGLLFQAECLLVIRVSLSLKPANLTLGEPRQLREEHVIVCRCFEMRAADQTPPADSIQLEFSEKRVLRLDMISEGFIDFSSTHIALEPSSRSIISRGQSTEAPLTRKTSSINLPSSNEQQFLIEVCPHISTCSAATIGGVLGLIAVFPPLDCTTECDGLKPRWSPGEDHGGKSNNESFVGIYDILESNKFRLAAWAAVPTRRQLLAGTELLNDEIVSVSLNQEWIAVMSESGQLYLYSILQSSPIPNAASLPTVFAAAAVALGLSTPAPPVVAVPVLAPIMEVSYRSQFSSLRFDAENHRRLLGQSISKMEALGENLYQTGAMDEHQGEEQVKYFRERKNLFDERLQLGRTAPQSPETPAESPESTLRTSDRRITTNDRLYPSRPGEMPILSFRRTRGDGLCLLVLLRCYITPDALDPSRDVEEFRLTPNVLLDLPPQAMPYLLLRSRQQGLERWWKSPVHLIPKSTTLCMHGVCWSARSDQILLSMSQIPSCLQDGCLPMQSMKLPSRLKYLARALSSPRPVYHPASLSALIKRSDDACLTFKILKRLLEGLTLWRHAGRPLPPTIDLPIAFLSSKPVASLSAGPKDTTLRNQLLARLRRIIGGTSTSSLVLSREGSIDSSPSISTEPTVRFGGIEKLPSFVESAIAQAATATATADGVLTRQISLPLPIASGGAQTAAALFGDSGGGFDDFNLDLDPDEELVVDHEEQSTKERLTQEEASFGAARARSPHLTHMKSFATGMKEFNEEEIAEASPLSEASLEDLLTLVSYLDISLPHNLKWLKTHMNLVPHLSIAESTQLLGMIRLLISLKQKTEKDVNSGLTFLAAVWHEETSSSKTTNVDLPGSRFLLSYHNALSVTASFINLVKTVGQNIKSSSSSEAISWQVLFPKGLSSVSSLEGDSTILSVLDPSDVTSPLNPLIPARYALTTSDLCWAIQCESDDILLQRTLSMWKRIAMDPGTTESPKLSWTVLRHVGMRWFFI